MTGEPTTLPERVPNATYTPDAEIIQEAAALLAQCGPEMDYADCADTALDGICALWGRDEDDKCTGMKTVAVPPEHEDGSAPEWKLLQYAARLTRIAQSQAAALAAAEAERDAYRAVVTRWANLGTNMPQALPGPLLGKVIGATADVTQQHGCDTCHGMTFEDGGICCWTCGRVLPDAAGGDS